MEIKITGSEKEITDFMYEIKAQHVTEQIQVSTHTHSKDIEWGAVFPIWGDKDRTQAYNELIKEKGRTSEDIRLISLVANYEKRKVLIRNIPI
jgi:hypothetical protein